ncbi:MAG: serine kinase [Pseudomonadota bacterium]
MPTQPFKLHLKNLPLRLTEFFHKTEPLLFDQRHRVDVQVSDIAFSVSCDDEHVKHCIREAHCYSSAGHQHSIQLVVSSREMGGVKAWPVWADPWFQHREVEAELRNTPYRLHYFPDLDFWQIYNGETRRGIQLMRAFKAQPPWEPGAPLRNFIHWCLLDNGASLVHSGTIGLNGIGVLLAGEGGSGKSGTVLSALLNRMQSVGDDYVAIQMGQNVTAHRAFNTLKQDAKGIKRLGVSLPDDKELNWQSKYMLNLQEVSQTAVPEAIQIKALCLPEVTGSDQTSFSPATAREAFLALAPSGIFQIPCSGSEMFSFAARLSRRLPAYRVRLGQDPSEIADGFRRLLSNELAH